MEFAKYTGLGNNFIFMDESCLSEDLFSSGEGPAAQMLCDPKFGIGADGLIIVHKSPLFMDIYNLDGSRAAMCGNGIRCFALYCLDNGIVTAGPDGFDVETLSGIRRIRFLSSDEEDSGYLIEVGMGIPDFSAKSLFISENGDFRHRTLNILGSDIKMTGVNTGEIHMVVWLDENPVTDSISAKELYNDEHICTFGRALCSNPIFTKEANIDFARATGPDEITMVTWERGVGLTSACGTGAVAAAAVGMEEKGFGKIVTVHLPYGDLLIKRDNTGELFKIGPARRIFTGSI